MNGKTAKRNTLQRSIVWETIQQMANHPSAEEVFEKIREMHPRIGRATVFRNLGELARSKKIKRLHMPYSADCYDFKTAPHCHIQCSRCGSISDIASQKISYDTPKSICGYKVTGFTLAYEGLCPNCQKYNETADLNLKRDSFL
ncbi:MAG: transcriptional repressor [Elusimicrobiota bacterium]|jgi:Fe2+ or Zn2+ uptake regulation protein|nr:transcriptional repressor [Elusimicrobiota bacterium]